MEPAQITTPTPTPVPNLVPPPPPNLSRNFLPWVIGGAIIILLLIIVFAINVGLAIIQSAFRYTPPPPAPTPAPVVTIKPVSSKYATDAGVLKLRDDLKTISQSVDAVDLLEPQIAPPALDLNISVKQN